MLYRFRALRTLALQLFCARQARVLDEIRALKAFALHPKRAHQDPSPFPSFPFDRVAAVKSGVGRYLEFMPLQSSYIYIERQGESSLERVPMSKGEIFQSKTITPLEKRLLMKFMQLCLQHSGVGQATEGSWGVAGVGVSENEQLGFQRAVGHVGEAVRPEGGGSKLDGKTLDQLMTEEKLTVVLKGFVMHSIALTGPETTAEEGVLRVQAYARSLGRYSDSAFLATYFGVGEVGTVLPRR